MLLSATGIEKRYAGVHALRGVGLAVAEGEVLALVGENGAGKSTLMRILAGVETPDAGILAVRDQQTEFGSVTDALRAGIAIIHQELQLADNLDVAENVFLGREPRRGPFRRVGEMRRDAATLLSRLGLDVEPSTRVSTLSLGEQQLVEIAKALSCDARLLIMDEPTACLSLRESEHLFRVVRELRDRGVAVIYISHRLGEVKELADRVAVLRDGKNAGELSKDEISHDAMVKLMVGRDVIRRRERVATPGQPILDVDALRTRANPDHAVSFAVRAGEIVGISGLVGAGRTELLNALFAVERRLEGSVRVDGVSLESGTGPRDAIAAGLALVPEDRKTQGLILETAIGDNLVLPSLDRLAARGRGGFRDRAAESRVAADAIRDGGIKAASPSQPAGQLSGGNQQKVVLGKWLALCPKVLLLDEPTRGVDVGAKAEIYALLDRLTESGVAVLFASSEMEEILGISDRVLVMHEGRIAGELSRADLSEEAVMKLATGGVTTASGAT